MQPRLSHIHQIAITVGDVDSALAFYRDALGLPFLFQPAPTLAFLQAGDVRLMLTTPQGAGTAGANSILYFQVQDIVPTQAALVARGEVTAGELLDDALEQGIMLGPGQLFMVDAKATGWMRFNVAFSTDPAMWELLEKVLVKHVRRGGL